MKNKIPSFSIILVFICLTLVGLTLIPLLPVKLSPSQTLPQVGVGFSMPGNSSRVIEMEVTSKLESMLSRIKGIESISSTSGNGWGWVSIRLDKHVNREIARFEVSTIIRQVWPSLPQGVSYPTISLSRSDEKSGRAFMSYTINAPATPILIKQFTENQIKPKLSVIEGINRILVSGSMPMEWRLEYDYKQLESLGITVENLQSSIQQYLRKEFLGTASIEDSKGEAQWIRVALVPEGNQQQDFRPENILIRNINGKLIALSELITIAHVEETAQSYYRINGLNSIYLSVYSDDNANQLDLSKKIKDKLTELMPLFPAGYEMHLEHDTTEYIQEELSKVYFRSGLTMIILLLFVLLIYRSLKYLFLIAFSLVVNLAVAVIWYYLFHLEIQLYSLAGITISLTLVIDNTIVMSDQIIRRKNRQAFLAILTATLTTIASLVIIFFMDEKIRLNLQDFAGVIIVNLSVSIFIALFLVPALLEKLKIGEKKKKNKKRAYRSKRRVIRFNRFYEKFCQFAWRRRAFFILIIILAFGLPTYLLPDKLKGESKWDELYNKTLGSEFYKEKLKTHVDTYLGGSLRLFAQKVFEGRYFTDREKTSIYVVATLPNGSTITQMNDLIQRMESYISQFPEVKQFQTSINSARSANINIEFTKESERSSFPFLLKSNLISKALELGGGSWGVYGLGDSFSNNVQESAGSYQVKMYGFNYDELNEWALQFKEKLLGHRRIKEVIISSQFSWHKDDYQEFVFDINKERLAQENIQPIQLFASIKPTFGQEIYAGQLAGEFGLENIKLHSKQAIEYDVWGLENIPGKTYNAEYKLAELSTIQKTQAPQNIAKEDQQYLLCLQYEYIGSGEQGTKVLNRYIEEFRPMLPLGYTIENVQRSWDWGKENARQYWLLLLIFIIIFFTCSILFNSLKQPLHVIFVIPISYIGVFLTFYLFKLSFDQGGFAAFVLLCGVAVNANIYVIDEYNNIRNARKIPPLKAYIKAWNAKISPIFLTVISTILGFMPFMIGYREAFWYPLAAGTMGGLVMSLVGLFFFLPLFMGVGKKKKEKKKSV